MAKRRFKIVTFKPLPSDSDLSESGSTLRLVLQLETPWELSAGIRPNTNKAVVSYKEFEKLGDVIQRTGSIEFWYTAKPPDPTDENSTSNTPDVEQKGWRLVDVEGIVRGFATEDLIDGVPESGDEFKFLEYRLIFADFRDKYTAPRGGCLMNGLINAGPKPAAGSPPGDIPEYGISQLMIFCLNAMGVADKTIPPGLDLIDPPRDIKWFGNHAPSELAKLMELAGCVFCPAIDANGYTGKGRIKQAKTTGTPTIKADVQLPTLKVPSIDRRGKTVVFSSFPNPVLETLTLTGPRYDWWYFVAQDSSGKWVDETTNDLLAGKGMPYHWRNNFTEISTDFQNRLSAQAYKFIKLGVGNNPPPNSPTRLLPPAAQQPLLNRMIQQDGTLADLKVIARIAYYDSTSGNFKNSDVLPIKVPALFRSDDNVVQLLSPLVRVDPAIPNPDLHKNMIELTAGQFQVQFSIPVYTQQDGVGWTPKYYHVGYTRQPADEEGETLRKLTDDEITTALAGSGSEESDIIFLSRPDLQLRIFNDNPQNKDALDDQAKSLANNLLADSLDPTGLIYLRGYGSADIDGLVSQVEWDQDTLITKVTVNDWYRPAGALTATTLLKFEQGLGSGQYPQQGATQETRTSLSLPGATQPQTPLNPLILPQQVDSCSHSDGSIKLLPSSLAGDGTIYNRDSDKGGAVMKVVTGVWWDTDAGQIWELSRNAQFDACGKLYSISSESRRLIDPGQDCGASS